MAMTKIEQKEFIEGLCNNVKEEMLSKFDKMPEEWDGIELRWYVKEKFEQVVWGDAKDKRSSKYRSYINEVITRNL